MKIYLCRHGEAAFGFPDEQRPLTPYGKQQVQNIAQQFNKHYHKDIQILHSPLLRAVQTCEIFCQYFSHKNYQVDDSLKPDDSPKSWEDRLKNIDCDILLIGHLPFMGILAEKLITKIKNPVEFGTANLVAIGRKEEKEQFIGKLNFHLKPAHPMEMS